MEEGGSHGRDQAAARAKPKKKSEAEVRVELVQAQRHHRELGKSLVHLPLDAALAGWSKVVWKLPNSLAAQGWAWTGQPSWSTALNSPV